VKRRGWVLGLVVVAGLVLVGLLSGDVRRGGPPLDPASTDADGTRALVEVLGQLGAHVDVARRDPAPGDGAVLVLRDDLDQAERTALLDWVGGGGTLVVADAASSLHPGRPDGTTSVSPLRRGRCDLRALAGVDALEPATPTPLFAAPAGTAACFGDEDRALVVAQPVGLGVVVGLADASLLTNERLGRADDAELAAALLAPRPGGTVLVERPGGSAAGGGSTSLGDLVPDGVWAGIAQLLVAFVLLALARGRRLGRPVVEAQPVQLPGSGLVEGVGRLLARAGHREPAAAALRAAGRADAERAAGLGPGAPTDAVVAALVARTGLAPEVVWRAVADEAVRDDRDLVAVAQAVGALRAALAPAVAAARRGDGGSGGEGDGAPTGTTGDLVGAVAPAGHDDAEVAGGRS
jgi:hypothetical protein